MKKPGRTPSATHLKLYRQYALLYNMKIEVWLQSFLKNPVTPSLTMRKSSDNINRISLKIYIIIIFIKKYKRNIKEYKAKENTL